MSQFLDSEGFSGGYCSYSIILLISRASSASSSASRCILLIVSGSSGFLIVNNSLCKASMGLLSWLVWADDIVGTPECSSETIPATKKLICISCLGSLCLRSSRSKVWARMVAVGYL